jgi:intracellular septation protein A
MIDLAWSFAPWIVFALAAKTTSYPAAVICGIVAAAVVIGRAVIRHHVHLLDVASGACFLLLGGVTLAVQSTHYPELARYAQAGAHATLTLIILGSILFGHPFTESYARLTTPEEVWHTPEFRRVNRLISAAWALAFLVGTLSLIAAAATGDRQILLRWLIPIVALYAAFHFTQEQQAKAKAPHEHAAANSGQADVPNTR